MTIAPLLLVTLLATPLIILDTPLLEEPVMDSLEFNVPTTVENAFLVELLNVSELLAASYWLDCTL